jgi:hypothetical protein
MDKIDHRSKNAKTRRELKRHVVLCAQQNRHQKYRTRAGAHGARQINAITRLHDSEPCESRTPSVIMARADSPPKAARALARAASEGPLTVAAFARCLAPRPPQAAAARPAEPTVAPPGPGARAPSGNTQTRGRAARQSRAQLPPSQAPDNGDVWHARVRAPPCHWHELAHGPGGRRSDDIHHGDVNSDTSACGREDDIEDGKL